MKANIRPIFIYFILGLQVFIGSHLLAQHSKKENLCYPKIASDQKKLNKHLRISPPKGEDDFSYILSVYQCNNFDYSKKTTNYLSKLTFKAKQELSNLKQDSSICCPHKDEIYLLLGKIYHYKQDYKQSMTFLDTVLHHYPNSKSSIEAHVWMSRNYMCLEKFEKAEKQLLIAEPYLKFNDSLADIEFNWLLTSANNYIEQDKYIFAIPLLERAVNHKIANKSIQTRMMYILAQLYQFEGRDSMAVVYYDRVSKQKSTVLMQSYAYVNADICQKRYVQKINDSLHWEELKLTNREEIEFEPTVIESMYDSSLIASNYPYYFSDPAAMFFLEDHSETYVDSLENGWYDDYDTTMLSDELLALMLENWDSMAIHIPKTDFKSFSDTIFLPLFDPIEGYELPHFGDIISKFGWRRYRYHYGIDTKNQYGEPIFCVFDGVVRIAKRNRTYGNLVIVRHKNGLETFYAHCSKLLVTQNQEVKAGDIIALIGSTGRSTGPHLHFEIRYQGNPINPEIVIDFENKKLRYDTLPMTRETFNYRTPYGQVSSNQGVSDGKAVYHKIRSGETLSGIARKYRTSVASIKRLNGLRSDMIREGRNLRVK